MTHPEQIQEMIRFIKHTTGEDAKDDVFLPAKVICALIETVENQSKKIESLIDDLNALMKRVGPPIV
jgi:hypothetical protein